MPIIHNGDPMTLVRLHFRKSARKKFQLITKKVEERAGGVEWLIALILETSKRRKKELILTAIPMLARVGGAHHTVYNRGVVG